MFKLTNEQLTSIDEFVKEYINAENAATGSRYDANANVTNKNIITLLGEMIKPVFINYNRHIRFNQMVKDFDKSLAESYIDDIENCRIYQHDETHVLTPYCMSISLFPFLQYGSKCIGGITEKPKHLSSFCGGLINLMNQVAATVAGACLYKDQILKIKINDNVEIIKIKDFISKFDLDNTFVNYQGKWEYADISKFNASVYENGKFVKINKIMRRAYKQDIYEIVSKTGLRVKVSQDHIFKQIYRNRTFETKANMLQVGDTLVVSKDYKDIVNKTSSDYLMGQLIGIIAGDGSLTQDRSMRISVNKHQTFIMDRLDALFEMFFNKKGIRSLDSRGEGVYSYIICGIDIVNQLKAQFIKCEKYDTYNKNITLENRSLDWQLGFLDGLIVTDGCFSKSHGITLTLTNEGLINTTKQILSNIDINLPQISSYTPTIKNRSTLFKIHIPAKITKYLDLVQQKPEISCDRNRIFRDERVFREVYYCGKNAAKRVNSNISIKRNTESHSIYENTDVITAINRFENDDEYVYEIETESHWYNCGGFITHNCAVPSLLVCFDFFARKDYGENYLKTNAKEIAQEFQHLVYYLNEPCSGRNSQSIFWNVSIFDTAYLNGLYGDFVYPDDFSKVNIPSVMNLQKYFLTWFNKERERSLLTFPVITCAMVYDKNKQVIDTEFKQFICNELSKGNAFFVYLSDSIESLSSCCFDGSQMTLTKSSNGVKYSSFADLFNDGDKNKMIFHNGSWRNGNIIKFDKSNKIMYSITTENNKNMIVTDDHIFPTLHGDKKVSELTTNDYLIANTTQLEAESDEGLGLSVLHGIVVGAYLGNGVRYVCDKLYENNIDKYLVTISLNSDNIDVLNGAIENITLDFECKITTDLYINNATVNIYSKELYNFIKTWVIENGNEKELNLDCLLQSPAFRKGIIQGYGLTTGSHNDILYIQSKKLLNQIEVVFTSIGIQTKIDTDSIYAISPVTKYNQVYDTIYTISPLAKYNHVDDPSYTIYKCLKIKSIEECKTSDKTVYCFEMADELDPYFTLPNGIITHNCRLRNESKNTFSFTLGNVGEMTGSVNVITINMNRFIQDTFKIAKAENKNFKEFLLSELRKLVQKLHKYHVSIRRIYENTRDAGMYPAHSAHFIEMDRQFSTIGINGLVEGAEFLGYEITPNEDYMNFCSSILKTISEENKKGKELYGVRFNTEFVPGENAGHKLAQWDKRDGYVVPRDCYNSYFYRVEDMNLSVIEKAKMHGKLVTDYLDGGSAVHYNMESYMTAEQYSKWIDINAYIGVNYFCTNILITCCEEDNCGHINKNTEYHCVKCGSKNISHATRIIGFLKKIKHFSVARQEESKLRYYHKTLL